MKLGYYPTSYFIVYDEARKEYSISIDGLTYHEAPKNKPLAVAGQPQKPNVKPVNARAVQSAQR